ncbi:putative glycosyltransferase [subsurface metagenome]
MTKDKEVCSVVIPVFNEEENLELLHRRLSKVLENLCQEYEIIFVDDGSKDNSLKIMRKLRVTDPGVKIISFSRNFGHQIAITAGIDYASGSAVIVMDADLQDPPEVIPKLVEKWREGCDTVYAIRESRKDPILKRAIAFVFYRLFRRMSDVDVPMDAGDFRLMSRRVVDILKTMPERNRYLRGLASWVGFSQARIRYARDERYAGQRKYSLWQSARLAFDGVTSFSHFPLRLAIYLGLVVSLAGFLYSATIIILALVFDRVVPGWTTLMAAVLFLGGVQLIVVGVIGAYIGRIYVEVQQRPLYLIKQKIGFSKKAQEPGKSGRKNWKTD